MGTPFHLSVVNGNILPEEKLPNLSISIVLYNSSQWLPGFLKSLDALNYPKDKLSLFFVDNGSNDQTNAQVQTFKTRVGQYYKSIQHYNRPNLGYGAGNDYAIRNSLDDFVLVTNVDTLFDKDSLAFAVTAAIHDNERTASWEFRQQPNEHPKYYDPVTLSTHWSSHACILIRRSAYLDVGGYETRLFMYGEDVELSYRFRAHGYRLRYLPKATMTHFVDQETTKNRSEQLSGTMAANILLRYKYGSFRDILGGETLFRWAHYRQKDKDQKTQFKTAKKIISQNRWHFFKSRKRGLKSIFPFYQYDYGRIRTEESLKSTAIETLNQKPLVTMIINIKPDNLSQLRCALLSALNQTYPNIEYIIAGPQTSKAGSIVREFMNTYKDANIRHLETESSRNFSSENTALKDAKGEYICFIDSDDLLFSDHIETLINSLLSPKNSFVASYARTWCFLGACSEAGKINTKTPSSTLKNFPAKKLFLFSRKLYETYGGLNENDPSLEDDGNDSELWQRYSEGGEFHFIPRVTSITSRK